MPDHRIYAAMYDRLTHAAEEAGVARRRHQLLAAASGDVLEIGGGTGLNLPHYPAGVSLTVLEPDGAMRRRLLARAAALGPPASAVDVHPVSVESASFEPESFDTVVCTLVLCTVPSLAATLGRIRS